MCGDDFCHRNPAGSRYPRILEAGYHARECIATMWNSSRS